MDKNVTYEVVSADPNRQTENFTSLEEALRWASRAYGLQSFQKVTKEDMTPVLPDLLALYKEKQKSDDNYSRLLYEDR